MVEKKKDSGPFSSDLSLGFRGCLKEEKKSHFLFYYKSKDVERALQAREGND